jgi:hypothetical protein
VLQDFKTMEIIRESIDFREDELGVMHFRNQLYVPDDKELKKKMLGKVHKSRYVIHPGEVQMYQVLKKAFWWLGMKKDTAH